MAGYENKPKGGTLTKRRRPQVVSEGSNKGEKGEKVVESSLKKLEKNSEANPEHDWSSDLVKGAKAGVNAIGDAHSAATDLLFDKKAWKNTAEAVMDGPGGKEVRGRDLANMALDATIAIPGAGVVGGLGRMGARQALKLGAKEAGEAAAPKLTGLAAQVAERKAAAKGASVAAAKHRGASPIEKLVDKGRPGLESAATRQTRAAAGDKSARILAGKGTRVGFNQTKRRIGMNALLAGGLNLGASGYNALMNGGKGAPEAGDDGVIDLSGGGPGSVGYYFVNASGEATSIPDSVAKTLAASYQSQGGSPDGSQVIYLGR